mmetsp:Transcript_19976/g.30017  ORF Transcript_19976/g.30017 Transcript_19976/m.30017 type:complete len:288 (+) Transcript_19976:135-998(+)|eukprot:CAMPEP_0178905208 /NCGR_PEP_ID=MMETSP0786-20121207/6139_1 /TAXON_ID=186022 /ORGANISM="Thalassionema frauenfeldii, Strain CCMP 1798" /LENGTH=287 /DNA_ID=CAMNT_0020576773 /DNA_START=100 /DNA_END=963 /DNA_ORIENTATION=+
MKVAASILATVIASASSFVVQPQNTRLADTFLAARKPFITGNWKLNPTTKTEAIELATGIANAVSDSSPGDVALFVPYPYLESVEAAVDGKVTIGAEFITAEESGAFTGGVSPLMLKSMGIEWALAGHSERRTLNGESDEEINKQCLMLIENGMNVVLCIGETLEEFEKGLVGAVCEIQLKKNLEGVSAEQMKQVTIAYEPVWAIGTGKVATPEIAQDVHKVCRDIIADMYDETVAEEARILYGGSVSPESVDGLMAKPDIDGTLVGGASLDDSKFARIINFEVEED